MCFVLTTAPLRTKKELEQGDPVSYKLIVQCIHFNTYITSLGFQHQ